MSKAAVRVLLLGENKKGMSRLRQRLAQRGCECRAAASMAAARTLLDEQEFDLILVTSAAHRAGDLMALCAGAPCTIFVAYPVEDGCVWLPFVRDGRPCLGQAALRPAEFGRVLDDKIVELEARGLSPARLQEVCP